MRIRKGQNASSISNGFSLIPCEDASHFFTRLIGLQNDRRSAERDHQNPSIDELQRAFMSLSPLSRVDSNDVRRQWAERTGEYSPAYYAYYGPNETSELLRCRLEEVIERDAPVLELGCSAGRHLAHLYEFGFDNLAGIEVNDDAFDVMAANYPDLRAVGEFYPDAIENVVTDFDDNQFKAVYSVETLQHLHPDSEWVFEELSRITDELLITVENEGRHCQAQSNGPDVNYVNDDFPLYYRDWKAIFTDLGFVQLGVRSRRRDTMRTFRTAPSSDEDERT